MTHDAFLTQIYIYGSFLTEIFFAHFLFLFGNETDEFFLEFVGSLLGFFYDIDTSDLRHSQD